MKKKTSSKKFVLDMNGNKVFEGDFVITDENVIDSWTDYDMWALNHNSLFDILEVSKVQPSKKSVRVSSRAYHPSKNCFKVELTESQSHALKISQLSQFL